ncbi:MAG: uncharacterized membrane protein (UPF0127 family) [Kiritimatiellia bacterium]|jgi:uncharacterized membrane protein (UPF0127 family)
MSSSNADLFLFNQNAVRIARIETAFSMRARMKGLLGRSALPEGTGMYIRPCSSIHTFAMHFTIDVVFVNTDLRVVTIQRRLSPNRMLLGGKGARGVIEFQSGWLAEDALQVGECVSLNP